MSPFLLPLFIRLVFSRLGIATSNLARIKKPNALSRLPRFKCHNVPVHFIYSRFRRSIPQLPLIADAGAEAAKGFYSGGRLCISETNVS